MSYEYPNVKLNPDWITGEHPIDEDVVMWTQSFGDFLSKPKYQKRWDERSNREKSFKIQDPLSTSQLRRFFGELKRIQASFDQNNDEIPLLKAKLAYSVGRDFDDRGKRYKSKLKEFYDELAVGLDALKDSSSDKKKEHYRNFVKIVEAIVAFHKFKQADNAISE